MSLRFLVCSVGDGSATLQSSGKTPRAFSLVPGQGTPLSVYTNKRKTKILTRLDKTERNRLGRGCLSVAQEAFRGAQGQFCGAGALGLAFLPFGESCKNSSLLSVPVCQARLSQDPLNKPTRWDLL